VALGCGLRGCAPGRQAAADAARRWRRPPSAPRTPLTIHARTPHPAPQNGTVGGVNNRGFVEVLAASQSPVHKEWFQGTADAVRQYLWLFEEAVRDGVEDLLILSGEGRRGGACLGRAAGWGGGGAWGAARVRRQAWASAWARAPRWRERVRALLGRLPNGATIGGCGRRDVVVDGSGRGCWAAAATAAVAVPLWAFWGRAARRLKRFLPSTLKPLWTLAQAL
jgi:hypothetical protein